MQLPAEIKKIDKQDIEDILALTPMQEGMLFHYLKNPGKDHYFEQLSLHISGKIDFHYFEQAWNIVIKANQMLRTVFRWEKLEKPSQVILKEHKCKVIFYDLSDKDSSQNKMRLEEIKKKDRLKTFDLHWVPFRVTLCKIDEKKYEAVISNHHILYDGWSNGIILKEFFKAYHELYHGRRSIKRQVKSPFKEFIKWIQNQDKNKQNQFWREYLTDFVRQTELPLKRRKEGPTRIENYTIILEKDIRNKLDIFVKNNRVTLASVFYSAWGLLLQIYYNGEDVIFGTTVSGRSAELRGIEDMVGLFINTIPMRTQTTPREKIIDVVFRTEQILQEREEFENTPLVDIGSIVDGSGSLFDTIVAIENYPLDNRLVPEGKDSLLAIHSFSMTEMTHYDLSVGIMLFNEIEIKFSFKSELFEKETIENLSGHFKRIIQNMIENPEKSLSQLEILSSEEKNRILYEFNNTAAVYPEDKTIQQLFEEQVERTPDHIAVFGHGRTRTDTDNNMIITYRQLNKQSDRLAGFLIEKGVRVDNIVGIIVERSIEMMIGIIGILKSGGAYLPIDPEYPQERIDYILKDSNARILLGMEECRKKIIVNCQLLIINYKLLMNPPQTPFHHSSFIVQHANHLAYIIYTSGSTGTPKGVMTTQRNVIRLIKNTNYIEFMEKDRILQSGAISFDASTFEIWGALLNGPALVLLPKEHLLNPVMLKRAMQIFAISIIWMTAPLFNQMVDEDEDIFSGLRCLLVGGDKLSPFHINRVRQRFPGLHINNGYGPTENTTFSTTFRIDREYTENIPIGTPIANSTVYIVDKYSHLLPIGVPGELYVGGDGVARGYLNRPELTAEKFIDLHQSSFIDRHSKLYRTGDLARWLPDGNIEIFGRIDQQVKIRGFRIEPGEIVNRLLKHKEIKDACVLAEENKNGDKYLAAYFVSSIELANTELRAYLLNVLPDYMIPSYFVRLAKIPLTSNGKIDHRALPAPEIKEIVTFAPPRNEIEKKLVEIWAGVLDCNLSANRIGIDENFFQLGGHSLKATSLASRIYKELNVKIPLAELFKNPTIRGLYGYINEAVAERYIPVEAIEKKEYYILSSAQKRLYFLQQMDNAGTTYNISAAWIIEGIIDIPALEQAIAKLIQRHESLRTSFVIIDEEPVQRIQDKSFAELFQKRLPEGPPPGEGTLIGFIRPFDLAKAPLLRVGLIEIEKDRYIFIVDMHHIISDGISTQLLMQDFSALYVGKELPGIKCQYKDYAEWQNREKTSKNILAQGEYWKKEYEEEIPVLELPIDKTRPTVQGFGGDTLNCEIGTETAQALKTLAFAAGTTLYMVLLALYNVFLAKITNQEDIIIGTPIAGRKHADLEKIIGMFVNTLALRNNPAGEKTFIDFLGELKESVLKGFENQEYQYEDLVEQIPVNRDAGRNPLFDTMFVLQNSGSQEIEIPGIKLIPCELGNKTSKFDLTLTGLEVEEKLFLRFEYSTNLFKRETVERFMVYFKNLVTRILENKNQRIFELEILTGEEKNRLLFELNDTEREYPKDKTIQRLFAEQAKRTPDRISLLGSALIKFGFPVFLTYGELNEQSNRLAYLLIEKGVRGNSVVGLMIERSIEMMVVILGILKSGGAYLPIDPNYPPERVRFMLQDSDSTQLITQSKFLAFSNLNREVINIDNADSFIHKNFMPKKMAPEKVNDQWDLMYIIYTSGSTGKPKGVMVQKGGFLNLLQWYSEELGIKEEENNLLLAPISFDLAQKNLFSPFLAGGRLTLASAGVPDYRELTELIHKEHVTTINCAPSVFYPLVEVNDDAGFIKLDSLRAIILGGEPIRIDRLLPWVNSGVFHCEIFNTYGPTECTDIATCYRIPGKSFDSQEIIPIGKPISNVKVYILDKYLQVLPIKIPGELCIGGIGLSQGYYNNKKLTEEKFAITPHLPEKKIYRTGDLTRCLPDGNIEFLGRIDYQVKIRGFRIELGEIENKLLKHEGIKEAVVISRQGETGDNYLCAYIVPHAEQVEPQLSISMLSISMLREYLGSRLPDYMTPSYFVFLDHMPLTPSGKIDRRRLPEPEIKVEKNYIAPRDQIEEKLVKIWCGVLDNKGLFVSIGIDDNFFQLGGHSLKVALMASRIHKEFKIKLPLTEIFKRPTIRGLAELIRSSSAGIFIPLEEAPHRDYYVLSASQRRMYLLHQIDEKSTVYNMPLVLSLEGTLEVSQFEAAIRKLIERHESFRTAFEVVNEEAVQRVHNNVAFEIDKSFAELFQKRLPEGPPEAIIKSFIRPFDLSRAPLLRVGLLKQEENKHLLIVDMHHIISDGMSMGIFVHEFMELYAHKELPFLRLQYNDYAEWQQREEIKEILKDQEKYWLEQFAGEIPVLNLPTDYVRPMVQSFEGRSIVFEIASFETSQLKKCALEHNTTLYMILLAAFGIFISKLSGQEDIVIGTPTAGRRHADLEPIIGMFVNTLALRHCPAAGKNFVAYLEEVTRQTLEGFENQDYPLEDLVEKVVQHRDMGRNPLFDVMFVLQNTEISEILIPGLKLSPYQYERETAKFDIILSSNENGDRLDFDFEYCRKLFQETTILRFIGFFKRIISIISGNQGMLLSEIEIISDDEKKQVLVDFNDTAREYPADKTIYRLFAEQVESTPDRIALVGAVEGEEKKRRREKEKIHLSYREFDERSGKLAGLLIEKGLLAGDIIAIMMERSIDLIIGILGILKAGGVYMPIDPEYPKERTDYMLKDSEARILITKSEIRNSKSETNSNDQKINDQNKNRHFGAVFVLNFENLNFDIISNFEFRVSNLIFSNLAYIMYTSGSTGKPKGVIVCHRNVVRLVKNTNFVPLNKETRILQTGAPVFDATTFEIWGSLLNGGQLVLTDKGTILDTQRLAGALKKNRINTLWLSSPLFNQLMQESTELFSPLKYLLVGGDILAPVHINRVKQQFPGLSIINGYGPTENTTFSATYLIEKEFEYNIPIGRPIANSTAYIYDKNNQVVPIGLVGELHVGGDGVALGYLNNPELTAEKFNRSYRSNKTYILYKTGDLARWLADGNIEFLSRIDHQVKIRGFRVEVGEIEKRLLNHPRIKEALVITRASEAAEDKYLCAYVVPAAPYTIATLEISELREWLAGALPGYMMPAFFMMLEKMPLNRNGKVDLSALPKPVTNSDPLYVHPRNEFEEKLADIWRQLLKIDKISIHDNFFEIGGHSLKVLHLVNAVQKEFEVKLDFQEVFLSPTIAGLSTLIQGKEKTYLSRIEEQPKKEYYELSYAQKRIWLLQQFEPQSSVFNLPSYITLHEHVDRAAVQKALEQLVNRHEAFRTYFKVIAGKPMQVIKPAVPVHLEFIDLSNLQNHECREKRLNSSEDTVLFNLEMPPLFRVRLIKYKETEFDLILTMHHIISDGWSMEILGQEFRLYYEASKKGDVYHLEPLKIQYKDYACWHNCLTTDKEKMQAARNFWEGQLKGDNQGDNVILNLPYDFPKSGLANKESAAYRLVIPAKVRQGLNTLAKQHKASLFMVLLTGFNLLLTRATGQDEILLAVPGAARQHRDVKNIIGLFVNTLVLGNRVIPGESFISFLERVRQNTLAVLEHQSYPLELICSEFKIRYPEIDVFFNMSIFGDTPTEDLQDLDAGHQESVQEAKFDIAVYVREFNNGIEISAHYYKGLFKPVTVEKLMRLYLAILENISSDPGKKVAEYKYGITGEKKKLKLS